MERFEILGEFFRYYDKTPRKLVTIEDIEALKERLRSEGYAVKTNKNGIIVVKTPEELESSMKRRMAMQMREAAKYTKLGAAIPIPLAREFSEACRKLGVSQLEILLPTIEKTIEQAKNGFLI